LGYNFIFKNLFRLPIVDVNIKDFGTDRQRFKLEIGQVCFS